MRALFLVLPLLFLTACVGAKSERFPVVPQATATKVRVSAQTVAITKVNLPAYAKEPAILVQGDSGALVPVPKADWADDTERSLMLSLVRNLGDITGATVAPDPWPLGGVPEAEIRVDVERMLVDRTLTMRLTGQFSIRRDRVTSRNVIGQFDISTDARSREAVDIVEAHAEAWQELAKVIARSL